jgi:diguanylate cyclase (GGDEF)-like protein
LWLFAGRRSERGGLWSEFVGEAANFDMRCNGPITIASLQRKMPARRHRVGSATVMQLHVSTLLAVTVFMMATAGLLLILSWAQNRSTTALARWGTGYLIGAPGAVLFALRGHISDFWSIDIANALIFIAYGLGWSGARSFEARQTPLAAILAGAGLWLSVCGIPAFHASLPARVGFASLIIAVYSLLAARELWRARDKELVSRWPAIALLAVHAVFVLGRAPAALVFPLPISTLDNGETWIAVFVFEALFTTFCMTFLVVNMAKERAELQQRRAAEIDALTGVANRRAFFAAGEAMLRRTIGQAQPLALLLFDLDRFKEINDTSGHHVGDRVLVAFGEIARAMLRPDDLFGRLGGEEFGCLLADTPMPEAVKIGERIRQAFERLSLDEAGMPWPTTVSVGVAMADEAGPDLTSLLAAADGALYRAKAKGRNRVELARAPLMLVEPAGAAAS